MINLKATLNKLKSSSNSVERHRISEITNLNCYIGNIFSTQAIFFSIEIDSNYDIHSNYLKRFVGVEVQIIPKSDDKKEVLLLLVEPELTDIFILFIEDLIEKLKHISSSKDALVVVSQRINYWKRLFGKFTGGLLTPQQQRGLFGELYLLKELLENDISNSKYILESWLAPSGTNQDFYFGKIAVEVKTSKSNNPSIKISNEYQLDSSTLESLYLVFYNLNEYPNDENTLLSLINEIRSLLNSIQDSLNIFNANIDLLGISQELEDEYNKTGYSIRNERYYRINSDFPKITTRNIDEAISKVSYDIDPKQCKDYLIEKEELFNKILHGK